MKLMKRISKIYNWSDARIEGCVNRNDHTKRSGLLIRMRSHRGLTLPEAMVSMSIFSMFMTVCCGSMVQYQTTFGRVERSMTYTQQLQAGLDMMVREISESNLSTFTDAGGAALLFPVDLSSTSVYFKKAISTNAHGDNTYDTKKIKLSVNAKDQLIREEILPAGTVNDSKTLAVNVDKVVLSRLPEVSGFIPNALSIQMTSTTTLSSKEVAMQQIAAAKETPTDGCGDGTPVRQRVINGCITISKVVDGGSPGDAAIKPIKTGPLINTKKNSSSNEKNYVSVERVVRLNN